MKAIENTNKTYFECFAFGDNPEMADELLALVLSGKKTATVSVVLENEQMEALKPHVAFSFWEKLDEKHTVVRFATSWATTKEEIMELADLLKKIRG